MKKTLLTLAASLLGLTAAAASVPLPYDITFDSEEKAGTWAVIDANQDATQYDAYTWRWSTRGYSCLVTSGVQGQADDWTISPSFTMKKGVQYEIEFYLYMYSSGYRQEMTFNLVNNRETVDPNPHLITPVTITSTNKNGENMKAQFTAPADGEACIGLHVNTVSNNGQLLFREFHMREIGNAASPGIVTGITATPGAKGALTCSFSALAPAIDAEGGSLSGTLTLKGFRNNETLPFQTLEGIAPGANVTFIDNAAPRGLTEYTFIASNTSGDSRPAAVTAFIGEDATSAVRGLTVSENNGSIKLAWQAPAEALHGCWVDWNGISYTVKRVADGVASVIAQGVKDLSYSDTFLPSEQTNISYIVVPVTAGGEGEIACSRTLNVGTPLLLPFADSFAQGKFSHSTWRQEIVASFEDKQLPAWDLIDQASVTIDVSDDLPEGREVYILPKDFDRGFARFNSNRCGQWSRVGVGRMVLPALDFSLVQNPVLRFYIFREEYYSKNPANNPVNIDDYVRVEVSADNDAFAPVPNAAFHRYGRINKWELCEVALADYIGKGRINISLTGNGAGGGPIYIDAVTVEDGPGIDMQAVALTGPERLRSGDTGQYTFRYKNGGGKTAENFSVELLRNGYKVATVNPGALKPGKSASATLSYTPENDDVDTDLPMTARVVIDGDMTADNDETPTHALTTLVVEPLRPALAKVHATVDEDTDVVTLTWAVPNHISPSALIEEDGFESYDDFARNQFGLFTTYDLDYKITAGIGAAAGVTYPFSGDKIAYQIIDPFQIEGIDEEELDLWATHSGCKMAIAPQAMSANDAVTSDDWLVFPPLSGNPQTISFWARGVNDNYKESMQAFYTNLQYPEEADDFLPCGDEGAINYFITSNWKKYTYSVPNGAKYFALRHTSADGYIFMVDDVSYERNAPTAAEAGLIGFNVYCDDDLVTPTPLAAGTRSFEHAIPAGEHIYYVAAVYPDGESMKCASPKINSFGSGVVCLSIEPARVEYFSPEGIRVHMPQSGRIYIVKRGNRFSKEVFHGNE